jgi:hypothetical protein
MLGAGGAPRQSVARGLRVAERSLDQIGLAERLIDAIFKFALINVLRRLPLNRHSEFAPKIGEIGQCLPSRKQLVPIGIEAELYGAGLGRSWGAAWCLRLLKATAARADGRAGTKRRRLRGSRGRLRKGGSALRHAKNFREIAPNQITSYNCDMRMFYSARLLFCPRLLLSQPPGKVCCDWPPMATFLIVCKA